MKKILFTALFSTGYVFASEIIITSKQGELLIDSSGREHTLECSSYTNYIALDSSPGTWGVLNAEKISVGNNVRCNQLDKFLNENTGNSVSVKLKAEDNVLKDYGGLTESGNEFSKNSMVITKSIGNCIFEDIEIVSHTNKIHVLRCELGNFSPTDIALNSRIGTWGVLGAEKIHINGYEQCKNLKTFICNNTEKTVIEYDDKQYLKSYKSIH